jgi:hypothetical protein
VRGGARRWWRGERTSGRRAGAARAATLAAAIVAAAPVAAPRAGAWAEAASSPGPTVRFSTPGTKTVTLTVCNARGCSTAVRQIAVLDPAPAITAFSVAPLRAEVGATVLLEASARGRPTLGYSWLVMRAGVLEGTLAGPSARWTTRGAAPGLHTVRLIVSNGSGSVEADQDVLLVPAEGTGFFTLGAGGCRLVDTRGSGPVRSGGAPFVVQVGGRCGIPMSARAVAAHATVVGASAAGFLSLFPGDYPPGPEGLQRLVSSVNFGAGMTRGNSLVVPVSTDGAARVGAALSLAGAGTGAAHLVVDVTGYFQAAAGPVAPIELGARLCALGFCEFGAGTRVFFRQAFSGGGGAGVAAVASYEYDWTGSGAFEAGVTEPVTSHVYEEPGFYWPAVRVRSAGSVSALAAAAPIFVNPREPAGVPAAPVGVSAVFVGFATFSPVDPTASGSRPAYRIAVGNAAVHGLGYNVYSSKNGAPYRLAAALLPALPANEPVLVEAFNVPSDTVRLKVTAVNFAGEGVASDAVVLSHP